MYRDFRVDMQPLALAPPPPDSKAPCGICRRQFSRYTCPACNVPYCALTCFRSEKHAQCSEAFYKREIESHLRAEPSKSAGERMRVMEMLKKLEEDDMDYYGAIGDEERGDEEDEHPSNLAQRLDGLDIGSVSPDALWSALSASERDAFMKAVEDPTSSLAQALLRSEELEQQRRAPWWDAPPILEDADAGAYREGGARGYGTRPRMMEIAPAIIQAQAQRPEGPSLLYNVCAVCIVYAYATRHLALSPLSSAGPDDPDSGEARRLVGTLAPFLVDKRSRVLFGSLAEVVTDVWSRVESMTSELFSLLLRDTTRLLSTLVVTIADPDKNSSHDTSTIHPEFHASQNTLLVLSDLATLFQHVREVDGTKRPSDSNVSYKLRFYAAYIMSLPSAVVASCANEVKRRCEDLKHEGGGP